MPDTYLPGNTRQRIQDLIKDRKITQAELAEKQCIAIHIYHLASNAYLYDLVLGKPANRCQAKNIAFSSLWKSV